MELSQFLSRSGYTTLRIEPRPEAQGPPYAHEVSLWTDFHPDVNWKRLMAGPFGAKRLVFPAGFISGEKAIAAIERGGAKQALRSLLEGLKTRGHERFVQVRNDAFALDVCLGVHETTPGPPLKWHARSAGGIRRHAEDGSETELHEDVLRLSFAMSLKNRFFELPVGGSKVTLRSAPIAPEDHARLAFLAWFIERERFLTGPDMGFGAEHVRVLGERYSPHATGGAGGPFSGTGEPTARGTYNAIRVVVAMLFGEARGQRVFIQGVGQVGMRLAELLDDSGFKLVLSDLDATVMEELRARFPQAELVPAGATEAVECDVWAPCGAGQVVGGAQDAQDCRAIVGAANNILRAGAPREELAVAKDLHDAQILFVPAWMTNGGGVTCGWYSYRDGPGANPQEIQAHIDRITRSKLEAVLRQCTKDGVNPLERGYAPFAPVLSPKDT